MTKKEMEAAIAALTAKLGTAKAVQAKAAKWVDVESAKVGDSTIALSFNGEVYSAARRGKRITRAVYLTADEAKTLHRMIAKALKV